MTELGLSCGTFNPIHDWHLIVAQCAMDQFGLGKVLLIPNGQPPHKKNDVLDKELRWEMVVAAAATNPGKFEACRIELDRQGPSYTLDTLTALKAQYGDGVRLNLLIGVDNIEPIPRWYKADEIFKLVRLLIAPRLAVSMEQAREMARNLPAHCVWDIIDAPSSSVSSTMIRDWIRRGRSVQYMVPPEVNRILMEKGHYRTASTAPTAPSNPPAPGRLPATPTTASDSSTQSPVGADGNPPVHETAVGARPAAPAGSSIDTASNPAPAGK